MGPFLPSHKIIASLQELIPERMPHGLSSLAGLLFASLLATMLILPICSWAETLGCPAWQGQLEGLRLVDGSAVEISSCKEPASTDKERCCKAVVKDRAGDILFEIEGETLWLEPISGTDINGDGLSDIVICKEGERYSYFIISPETKPPLLKQINNRYAISFKKIADGTVIFLVLEGGFKNHPDLVDIYHYDLLIPEIPFVLEGRTLKDVSSRFRENYDWQIQKAREKLTAETIAAFKKDTIEDAFESGLIKGHILKIVFAYLYSGRECEAWEALSQMWPPADMERMKRVIIDIRAAGSLRLSTDPSSQSLERVAPCDKEISRKQTEPENSGPGGSSTD